MVAYSIVRILLLELLPAFVLVVVLLRWSRFVPLPASDLFRSLEGLRYTTPFRGKLIPWPRGAFVR